MKALILVACVLASAAAQAETLKAALIKTDALFVKAIKARDFTAFEKLLNTYCTADCKYIQGGKSMTKAQMVAQLKGSTAMLKSVEAVSATPSSVVEKGSKGSAVTTHVMKATMMGSDKKTHTMTMTGVSKDEYVKKSGKWLMSKMTWVSQTMAMDGKPMKPQGMASAGGKH